MEEAEDDDLKLQRASTAAIEEIKSGIANLVSENVQIEKACTTCRPVNHARTSKQIVKQLEHFQEEPQLLDPHLRYMIPPLASEATSLIGCRDIKIQGFGLLDAISETMYTFCKVRGEKVITRFLNNEPKWIVPMLKICQKSFLPGHDTKDITTTTQDVGNGINNEASSTSWQRRYLLLLWINHLMLTPFDLSSISSAKPSDIQVNGLKLPTSLPPIATDVIRLCIELLSSVTKEQNASASLLVRLALRPDMQRLGLLETLIQWCLLYFVDDRVEPDTIHGDIGRLLFLNGLVRLAENTSIFGFLPNIYQVIRRIFTSEEDGFLSLRASAVPKKVAIKIQRNIAIQMLKADEAGESKNDVAQKMFEETEILESVIDYLMTSLADRDTQVRYAASKSLALITTKLDNAMAGDITQAILEAYNDDVVIENGTRRLTAVNPQLWHGLTLTLSHLLFRRSPFPNLLPEILHALYLGLTFEQRSPTGNSTGGNVRDAANFGLWSLARRYTTAELMAVDKTKITTSDAGETLISALQQAACELLTAACLDPAGNVRRGSSAALQELIGRHPNTIIEGIPLVQAVDYHSVGLQSRAMTEVAMNAARLDPLYREVLEANLFGWRGVCAPDAISRRLSAAAIGDLICLRSNFAIEKSLQNITARLEQTSQRSVEERHGLILSLAAVVNRCIELSLSKSQEADGSAGPAGPSTQTLNSCAHLWKLFATTIQVTTKDLSASSLRPELLVEAVITLVAAITSCSLTLKSIEDSDVRDVELGPNLESIHTFSLCLTHADATNVNILPFAAKGLLRILGDSQTMDLVGSWITALSSSRASSSFGIMLALGAAWSTFNTSKTRDPKKCLSIQDTILEQLTNRAAAPQAEVRVHAVRSLALIVESMTASEFVQPPLNSTILQTFHSALNDYTINERGDVGSLVRLEGLIAMGQVWQKSSILAGQTSKWMTACVGAVHRLALEKLDKVRLQAALCLEAAGMNVGICIKNLTDVSSYDYFVGIALLILSQTSPPHEETMPEQLSIPNETPYLNLLTGFATSAGTGAESLQQTARAALHDVLTSLPVLSTAASPSSTQPPTLLAAGAALITLLSQNLSNDRLLHPLLELVSFLLDSGTLHPLLHPSPPFSSSKPVTVTIKATAPPTLKPLTLLSLIQKSHFKSTSIAKLLVCVSIYRSLADVPVIKAQVLTKLLGMLAHPFPKVRVASAEALWLVTGEEMLMGWNWVEKGTGKEARERVEAVRRKVLGGLGREE